MIEHNSWSNGKVKHKLSDGQVRFSALTYSTMCTDIDLVTELGGNFFVMEFKPHRVQIREGQRIVLSTLAKCLEPYQAVYGLVQGDCQGEEWNVSQWWVAWKTPQGMIGFVDGEDFQSFKDFHTAWVEAAYRTKQDRNRQAMIEFLENLN